MQIEKTILDMCCGSRMFWFDRADPRAVFVDIRAESHILCDGRKLEIAPDLIADFRQLPFADNTFQIVVFDPPHLTHCGPEGWQGKKYGILSKSWKDDLTKGFAEAFRVLRAGGVLIFKWNEVHIPTRDIIKLSPVPPIFGHPSGKRANTNWVCFQKPGENLIAQLEAAQKERDALREVHIGAGSNTRAAADIYFQLVEELEVPAGGSLVGVIENLKAELSAANEKLKGDQVPVAIVELNDNLTVAEIRGDIPRRKAVRELYEGALVIGQELFAAAPRPAGFTVEGE
ncbi:hypothetical protein [Yersinia enterocolitica]|uniref:hypothetical protein n=1 Tax=Yersinia enterocolitica TaxID=630 RepID=UPI003F48C0BF